MVIQKGWLQVNLSQLGLFGELKNGFAFKSSDYQSSGIPLIKIGNFKNCNVDVSSANYLPEDFLEKHSNFLVSKNDLLIAMSGATTGKIAVVKATDLPAFLNQRVGNLGALNRSLVYEPYLPYLEIQIKKELMALAPGSAMPNISKPVIEKLQILLPPLEEQRRIAARIEELAGKIEEVRSLRQQALEETEALRVSSAKAIFTELAKTNTQPLRELVTVQGGGTPSKNNPLFWEGSIPWISPKDMKRREISDSIDHISEEATLKTSAKLVEPGSVLIVVRGMILAHTVPSAILRVPAAINQDIKALVPSEQITPEYLCGVLWGLNYLLLELIEKSSHDTRKLETPKLLNFKIPVPSISEQRRIVAHLDNLQAKVDEMKRLREGAMKELDAMLPSILDKAFKGEL